MLLNITIYILHYVNACFYSKDVNGARMRYDRVIKNFVLKWDAVNLHLNYYEI